MIRSTLIALAMIIILPSAQTMAMPPADMPPNPSGGSRTVDQETFYDKNNILMLAYNDGNIASDAAGVFSGGVGPGFFYPYSGDPGDPGSLTVVWAAGLWMGGMVGSDIRLATAEYDAEYVPGPMDGGGPMPDDPSFRVYRIDGMSGPGDADYDEWPVAQGAPSDEFGKPLLMGRQTLWAVFNDADPMAHVAHPGGTDPLGVEVQMTVWGSDMAGEEDVLFVRYKLYNKGLDDIDSFYICFWADPDIGFAPDDLVGCDTVRNAFFAYNSGYDDHYGAIPPAWGGMLLSGPVEPSPGDTAVFDSKPMPDYRNLPMTAYVEYINGTDPNSPEETYNYMRGLNQIGGPIINPVTSQPTSFMYSGDPVAGTGWVDVMQNDSRFMMAMGPLTFASGDSQQVVLKLGASFGGDPLLSVNALKNTLDGTAMKAVIDPNKVHTYYVYAVDPRYATVYFGNMVGPNTLYDIDPGSVRINDSIVPETVEMIYSHVEFVGPVIEAYFPIKNFIYGYAPVWDLSIHPFMVSCNYNGVRCVFSGELTFFGHVSGDADGSGFVDIDDIVFLVAYVFSGGATPRPLELGDANCSDVVDIDDITYLVQYIFVGGPQPCPNGH
ncbi:MAG: hypothetical protein ABIK83_06240 [Candidatus Zixiibacteriota bacterium]